MLTFGWGEILLVIVIIIVFVGPKDLPKLIKQISFFTKSLKKLSKEFKSSLNEIAEQEEFKDVKSSLNEVNKIKNDFNINNEFKKEIDSLKETNEIVKKEVKDFKNINSK